MKRLIWVLIFLLAVCFVSCVSQGKSTDDLDKQIEQLETEIKQLEAELKEDEKMYEVYRMLYSAGSAPIEKEKETHLTILSGKVFRMRVGIKEAKRKIESLRRENNPQDVFKVTRVIDGNTIVFENGEKVRLIGVNCFPNKKGKEVDEAIKAWKETGYTERTILMIGEKGTKFVKKLCGNKEVRLEYDETKRDKYGRLLAYVYLPDGKLLNEEIILEGRGGYYDKYPFSKEMMKRFREAQKKALIKFHIRQEYEE